VAGDRAAEVVVDHVDHRLDADPGGDVVTNQISVPTQSSANSSAPVTRGEGTKALLAHGAHGAQHHQGVGEGAEEDAERQLVARVADEVAQQPRPHLAGGQRERRDGFEKTVPATPIVVEALPPRRAATPARPATPPR
jgi:hypothetical protein